MLQYLLTILIVTACVVYAVIRIRKITQSRNDPCSGCKGCALNKEMRKKKDCAYKTPLKKT